MNTSTVTRPCPFGGEPRSIEVNLSPEEYKQAVAAWEGGLLIQQAFPTLSADDREFILTGFTPEDWEDMFGTELEDDVYNY